MWICQALPLLQFHKHHLHFNHPLTCTTAYINKPVHVPQFNWSQFKPEFAGKPDEDAEVHILRRNDWMDTHEFQEGVKVQHLCLH